jgi:hypothetical protein
MASSDDTPHSQYLKIKIDEVEFQLSNVTLTKIEERKDIFKKILFFWTGFC